MNAKFTHILTNSSFSDLISFWAKFLGDFAGTVNTKAFDPNRFNFTLNKLLPKLSRWLVIMTLFSLIVTTSWDSNIITHTIDGRVGFQSVLNVHFLVYLFGSYLLRIPIDFFNTSIAPSASRSWRFSRAIFLSLSLAKLPEPRPNSPVSVTTSLIILNQSLYLTCTLFILGPYKKLTYSSYEISQFFSF